MQYVAPCQIPELAREESSPFAQSPDQRVKAPAVVFLAVTAFNRRRQRQKSDTRIQSTA